MKHVLIRPDCRECSGGGHLYRALRLAQALRSEGIAPVVALSGRPPATFLRHIEKSGIPYQGFSSPLDGCLTSASKSVLVRDCEAILELCSSSRLRPEWIVSDHYLLDSTWEARIRSEAGAAIGAFDDGDGRKHACDLLINSSLAAVRTDGTYRRERARGTRLLLGPRYYIPDENFSVRAGRRSRLRTMVLFLGGSADPALFNSFLRVLTKTAQRHDITVKSVAPFRHARPKKGSAAAGIVHDYSKLATLLESADLFVGSGGTISYDRLLYGIPGVVVDLAPNQIPLCKMLSERGCQLYLGSAAALDPALLEHAIELLVASPHTFAAMQEKTREIVDERGGERVAKNFCHFPLKLRNAGPRDEKLVLAWRNSRQARAASFSTAPISASEHHDWYRSKLSSRKAVFLIAESPVAPLAFLRYELTSDHSAVTSIALNPIAYGLGLAGEILTLGTASVSKRFPRLKELTALIKPENAASIFSFQKAGFQKISDSFRLTIE